VAATPRVLVVEDDPEIRQALRRALLEQAYEVECAGEALTAAKRMAAFRPHVVLLDLLLPRGDGVSLCRQLRAAPGGQKVAVIMVTSRDALASRVAGLEAGADDYVVKPFAMVELLARVRAQIRRVWQPEGARLTYGDLTLDTGRRCVERAGSTVELSPTEYHLLETFLRQPERVLSRAELGQQVWGVDFGPESNLIEVTVGRLRRKLESGGRPPLITTVRGAGYALRGALAA
jgi:two-component system response regulator MprA